MSHYGRYGRGLDAFVDEWGLNSIGDEKLDPMLLEALQSVLDVISPERGYRLSFVPSGTAATSFSTKRVIVTSEALRGLGINDPTRYGMRASNRWSHGKRFRITAGMVCHEVSHIRYGQDTAGAVERLYKSNRNLSLAQRISNVLDDTRIEMAFAWDFPGFGKPLFDQVLEWVARKGRENPYASNRVANVIDRATALDAILLASRYDKWYAWPEHAATVECRIFGKAWAHKYTKDDTVATHLAGVKACIEFLRQFPKPVAPTTPPPDYGQPGPPPPPESEDGEDDGLDGEAPAPDFGDEDDDDQPEPQSGGSQPESDEDEDEDEDEDGYGSDSDDEDGDEEAEDGSDATPADEDEDGSAVLDDPKPNVPDMDSTIESAGTAADKATNRAMDEVAKTRETIESAETGGKLVRVNRSPMPRKPNWETYGKGKPDLGVAHEVRMAFESTRFSHDEWAGGHQTGRFRSRDSYRAASGDLNVFSRRENESSTRIHLAMLIDYSGSMSGTEHANAMRLASTIAAAMETSSVFRQSIWRYMNTTGEVKLDRLWTTGSTVTAQEALQAGGAPGGSTPTGEALYALGREMLDDRRSDEALLVISLTDGAPDNDKLVVAAREQWTDRGVAIIGVRVGFDNRNNPSTMRYMADQYGEGNVIEFVDDYKALAEDIGAIVGRVLAGTLLPK